MRVSEMFIQFRICGSIIHVISLENVTSPTVLYHMEFDNVDLTDVEVCGQYVIVGMDNELYKEQGRVVVFDRYSSKDNQLSVRYNITVGSLPDMVHPTSDCKTILVAVEAEAYLSNGEIVDPEGGVGIIKLQNGNFTYRKLDFKAFNSRWLELESKGLRFVYRENNNTLANDLEPEYISLSKDETKVYVCLQENNAIAIVNVEDETIEDIVPLGFKEWGKLDASDKNGIKMLSWPIYGMYQPDSIHVIDVLGISYLVTANEGDSKDYSDWGGYNEEVRVKDVTFSDDASIITWAELHNISGIIQNDDMLGRLKVTKSTGTTPKETHDALYAFGARGFSIWRLDTMQQVYDSGSEFEEIYEDYIPKLFNNDGEKKDQTVSQTTDTRSDDKGPECESLAVAHIGGDLIIFVGNERPGSIFIYKISGDATKPEFQSLWHGVGEDNGSWEELYERRKISEIDPEDIRYIPADKSPIMRPLLTVAGSVTGTFSVFKINGVGAISTVKDTGSNFNGGFHVLISMFAFLKLFI